MRVHTLLAVAVGPLLGWASHMSCTFGVGPVALPLPCMNSSIGAALDQISGQVYIGGWNGCSPVAPGSELAAAVGGRIALVSRGECSFLAKAEHAEAANAAALVVFDNQPNALMKMRDPTRKTVDIPVLSITQRSAQHIAELAQGEQLLAMSARSATGAEQPPQPASASASASAQLYARAVLAESAGAKPADVLSLLWQSVEAVDDVAGTPATALAAAAAATAAAAGGGQAQQQQQQPGFLKDPRQLASRRALIDIAARLKLDQDATWSARVLRVYTEMLPLQVTGSSMMWRPSTPQLAALTATVYLSAGGAGCVLPRDGGALYPPLQPAGRARVPAGGAGGGGNGAGRAPPRGGHPAPPGAAGAGGRDSAGAHVLHLPVALLRQAGAARAGAGHSGGGGRAGRGVSRRPVGEGAEVLHAGDRGRTARDGGSL